MSARDFSTCDSDRWKHAAAPLSDGCIASSRSITAPILLLSLSVLLSACGSGSSDNTAVAGRGSSGSSSGVVAAGLTGTIPAENISSSASQLANDATFTLSDALALASGGTPPGETSELDVGATVDRGDEQISNVDPQIGVNPAAVIDIPTAAAATPEATPAAMPTGSPFEVVDSASNGNAVGKGDTTGTSTAATSSATSPDTSAPDAGAAEPTPTEQESTTVAATESDPDAGSDSSKPEPVLTASTPQPATSPTDSDSNKDEISSSGSAETRFESKITTGFVGEVLDDRTVKVSWPKAPNARGYNVYRQSEYYASVSSNEMIDDDIFDGDYYYEIQSYDHDDKLAYIAFGLTVRVSGTGRTDPDAPAKNANLLRGYDLVFADEFDTGALDTTKWNTAFLWGPDLIINSEEQYYVDTANEPGFGFDPFSFKDGKLVISAIKTPAALRNKANNQPYLSGIITSYDSFKFTYGYVETRARMPYGKGLWPAFWLLNAYYVDAQPEIDIMEFIGDNPDTVYHTYHYYDSKGTLRSTHSEPTKGTDWTNDFHTYGVDWRPGLLVFYIDGVEVHRVSDPSVSSQDMYLLANTALGGWWAGSPDAATSFPARYELDYIRVYRQTQPYGDPPLSDGTSNVKAASEVDASPAHRPPFELWPEGYPGGR